MFNQLQYIFAISIGLVITSSSLMAQDQNSRKSELGVRQQLVERKMEELETKLTVIAERLREKEPERAQRLIAAYQQSKERLITKKMAEVRQLLDQNQLPNAEAKLEEVIENLEALIRLLTNEKDKTISKQEEMQMLERWRDNIQERIREQQTQRTETEKVSKKEETVKNLEAQIAKLKNLIEQQRDVIKSTEESSGAGLRQLDQIADRQFEVRQGTESLQNELGGTKTDGQEGPPKQGDAGDTKSGKPGDPGKPNEDDPTSEKDPDSKEGNPEDSDPADPKSNDAKSGESKSGESKSGESKSGESKSGESQSGEPQSGEQPPRPQQPPQPGQQALQKATEHQQKAEEKLGSGKSADAKRQEEDALDEMDKALSEIEKEKRRIESLPPEALEQMADQQRRTRDKAMELVEEMKKAPKPKPEPGQPAASDQPPGQQPMEQASDAMQQASNDLQDQNPEDAEQKQEKSAEKMAEALQEIEERLNQLREETREEKLARLEARFREMLDRQIVNSVMTVELNDKRTNLGDLRRRDQLLLLQLANEELEISEIGQQAYDLLLEDGTSIVFPEIVQELRDDLGTAAGLLQEERTDRFTQLIHKEIETTIQDLLDALAEAKGKKQSGGGGGGGGGGGKQPLLKTSAELKILKMQQLRLNRRTQKVEQMRGTPDLDPLLDGEAQEAAVLQAKLLEMTEGIMEKSE